MISGQGWQDAGKLYNVEVAGADPDGRKVFMVAASNPTEAIQIVNARWIQKWNTERVPIPECVSVILLQDLVLTRS